MPDESGRANSPRARQVDTGHTRHFFDVDGRAVEVEVLDMDEGDYARHASALGPLHSTARLGDRVRVVRLVR